MQRGRPRRLGAGGPISSCLGLGTYALSGAYGPVRPEDAMGLLWQAVGEGVTLFDTSDSYGLGESESLLGRALGNRRDEVVIATKFGSDLRGLNGPDWGVRGSRRYIRKAVESSLSRLGTDHIDLYQLHFPDGVTPIEETLTALDELVGEGKVRYIGSSNLAAWRVVDADWTARTAGTERFISAQNKYSLYDRRAEAAIPPMTVWARR